VQVVQYLLAHNYLLTALELLVEAQEAGNEEDVDSLQHFFSDQAKFPAEVVAKYDPNDGTTGCLHNPAAKRNAGSRLLACSYLYGFIHVCCFLQQSMFSNWHASVRSVLACLSMSCVLLKRILLRLRYMVKLLLILFLRF